MAEQNPSQPPNVYEEITVSIRNGEYFKDAIDWYTIKYIQPVSQRSFFLLITSLSLIFSVAAVIILLSILPIVETLPLVVENSNMADNFVNLEKLALKEEDPNVSVIKYLSKEYLEKRESYNFDVLKNNLAFMKNSSSPEEYQKYVDYMRPENPKSPLYKYRNHSKRSIVVKKVTLLPQSESLRLPPGQHRVLAYFVAKDSGPAAEPDTAWKASLDVRFSDVVFYKDKKQFSPMDFLVMRYEVEQVEDKK